MAENLEFLTICFECRAIKQGDNWLAPTTQEYQEIMRKYNREDRMTKIGHDYCPEHKERTMEELRKKWRNI